MLCATIVLFFVFVGMDTPRFYIMSGQHEKAKYAIRKIYNTENDVQKLNNIYLAEKAACPSGEEEGSQIGIGKQTMRQVLWTDEKYARASWTAILIMASQCLTGYYAIIAYSEILLNE